MLTKTSAELTLFDRLSQLTFVRAVKLLGAKGSRLIAEGGKYDIDITTQVKFNRDRFQLALGGATAMPPRSVQCLREHRSVGRDPRRQDPRGASYRFVVQKT